ncbi:MAG: response regulator, partial [Planctomycetes bacterium]|nr:response regulator [Planctomycetota bacterium]
GDLARYCQVTPATIVNWIRAKKLDVYTTPGGQYRMELHKFRKFLTDSGFPIPEELHDEHGRRVLIVDDDEEIVEMLTDALESADANYDISGASNGYDALIKLGSFKPEVLILDLMMPKMDGVELCRRLRANPDTRNIRIIAITALDSEADEVRKIKDIGVETLLAKPVNIDKLCGLVAQYVSRVPA